MERDFTAVQEGSILRITPLSQAAKDWLNEEVEAEPWMWLGPTLCVDWRCGGDILHGMEAAGLVEAE